ncbi:DMT family transporter [Clostridium sp. BJN0013]|uniref:DMT family transporter n=1 Tax=Clostridium sp. BJN0013 TaxID=3236840 RepID=UPI0034C68531
MIKKADELKVVLAYTAVCIFWGSTYLAMRVAASQFPPELFAGIRFILAGLIMLGFSIVKRYKFPSSSSEIIKASIPGILMLLLGNGLIMWAEQWVHSGITAVLIAATPLFTAGIEAMVLKESKVGPLGWLCLIVGFVGVSMLIFTGMGVGSIDIKGGVIVLMAAVFGSIGMVCSKKIKVNSDIFPQVGIQMLTAGIGLSCVGIAIGEGAKVHLNYSILLSLVYLVIFGSIIGYTSNIYVLSKWPASIASSSNYVTPVVAVILGALILNEKVSLRMIFFMGMTLGGVILLQLYKNSWSKKKWLEECGNKEEQS